MSFIGGKTMFMIREIFGYCIISAIGLICMFILYVPICFLLKNKISPSRQLTCFLFGACVIIILAATVVVGASKTSSADRSLNIIPFQVFTESWSMPESKKILQTVANIVMFIPISFMIPVTFRKMRRLWKTALYLSFFSFIIEFTQYFTGRSADIDDLILNTIGGILGYLIFFIFTRLFKKKHTYKSRRKHP